MGKPQVAVVVLVALGLVIFVQVLRITGSHTGLSPFVSRSPLNRGPRARALGVLAGLAPAGGGQLSGAPDAPAGGAAPDGLGACEYHAAPDPRALGPGPHEPPSVPLSDTTTCPGRSPFHTILTAQGSTYQDWQARIMYYHWRKQRATAGPCTDMTGFTRLCASAPDSACARGEGLSRNIPTIFIEQLPDKLIKEHFNFGVLNRPHSLKVLLQTPALLAAIPEDFFLIAETDHVLTRPLPNLATAATPAAYVFGYMHASARVDWVIKTYWPEGNHTRVQPVGPSPLLIAKAQLAPLVDDWLEFSLGLRSTAAAESVIQGWVQEMWGYSIAAAKGGVVHKLVRDFQVEPGAMQRELRPDYWSRYFVHHYTYGIEFKLDGSPQGHNQIGEWSLDKRHYGGAYPPRNLEPPPKGANAAACWLVQAWNEAMDADPDWPDSAAFGTVGWRRGCTPEAELRAHSIGGALLGSKWTWAGIPGLEFSGPCEVKTPWGKGKWGLQTRSRACDAACVARSVFLDFSGALHSLAFQPDAEPDAEPSGAGAPDPARRGPGARRLVRFVSTRVGDGEKVIGLRQD